MKNDHPKITMREARHYFFLNPYQDIAFTHCPKCEGKTRIRKFCLMIHIQPMQLISMNKFCRFCPTCDLIIAKQAEFESLLAAMCEQHVPDRIGDEYFIFGTMDRNDWKNAQARTTYPHESLHTTYPFKDVLKFEVLPGGWYPETDESG